MSKKSKMSVEEVLAMLEVKPTDSGKKLAAFAEQDTCHHSGECFDDEGGRYPYHVSAEQVREHGADACGKCSHAGTEDNTAQQYHAVTGMDVSACGSRDLDDHCADAGQCCKQCGNDPFFG